MRNSPRGLPLCIYTVPRTHDLTACRLRRGITTRRPLHFSRPYERDLLRLVQANYIYRNLTPILYSDWQYCLSIHFPDARITFYPYSEITSRVISNHHQQHGNGLLVCWLLLVYDPSRSRMFLG